MERVSPWVSLFLAAEVIWLGAALLLIVAAFRTSIKWGLLTLFVPFFGGLIFVCKHWEKGGIVFLVSVFSRLGCVAVFLLHLDVFLPYLEKRDPALAARLRQTPFAPTPPPLPPGQKREAVDVAEVETPLTQRDALLNGEAAYAKHALELNVTYEQLKAARAKLKGGGPALAAYNAKAAHYQEGLQTLALEKSRLDSLHGTVAAATAAANAATQTVANVSKGGSGKASPTPFVDATVTRAAMDAAVKRIQTIVNQVPPAVPKPPGTESWNYGFHPGATKPDFDNTDIVSGRELWPHDFIDMQGSPNVYYHGPDCEFNSQTKFFYTNRELPKKRLTELEIAELVRLYRFLGRCQRELGVTL